MACADHPSNGRRDTPLRRHHDRDSGDNWGCLWCREAQLGNQVVWNPSGSAPNSVLAGTPRSQHGAATGRDIGLPQRHIARSRMEMSTRGAGPAGCLSAVGKGTELATRLNKSRIFVRQKARSRCEEVTATVPVLLRSIKPSRLDEIKVFSRTRHRNVEQSALLVDLLWFASGHVRRDAAIHKVENEDGVPFLPFGGVDRRQDQIVFVD